MNRLLTWSLAHSLVVTLTAAPGAGRATAQIQPPASVNNFAKLFQNPTGQNGYEEFVRAGDMLQNSAAWRALEGGGTDQPPTLAMKRQFISDPAVRSALETLKAGLMKPVHSPRQQIDDETLLPELAPFRALARALGHEIYVQLADGRVSQAIDTLMSALKFGYVVQMDTVISGLVAISIDAIALRPVGDHLDQLSVHDCDKLLALAKEWMELPDPAISVLESDRRGTIATLEKYKADPVKLFKMMNDDGTPPAQKQRQDALAQSLAANPNAAIPLFDQAKGILAAQYDHALVGLKQPAWDRKPFPPIDEASPAGTVASALGGGPVLTQVMDRYAREQAQVQMLGIHAAIHHYLWEFNTLPGSLDELKLGKLILDPFSGRPFDYKRLEGNRYVLSSVGPIDRSPTAASGQRTPITLGPNR
jgi:hypothetical protein